LLRKIVSAAAGVAIVISGLTVLSMPAQGAATLYNVAQGPLDFDLAKETPAGGVLSNLICQREFNPANLACDSSRNLGSLAAVGHSIDYYDIVKVGGVQIDARLTVVAQSGMEGTSDSADGRVRRIDDNTSTQVNNRRIRSDLYFAEGKGNEWVEYKIEFFTGLETDPNTAIAVELENVALSVYDIDSYQYFESKFVESYQFTEDTILTASAPRSGVTRFAETNGVATSNSQNPGSEQTLSRVTIFFEDTDEIRVRLGQDNTGTALERSASMSLDFGLGLAWGSLVAPPAPTTAPTFAFPQAQYGVSYFLAPPFVQGSYVGADADTELVDFNSVTLTAGAGNCADATAGLNLISFASAGCKVEAAGQYGGASSTNATPTVGGAGSNYASTTSSSAPVVVSFTQQMRYLGFWWSAGSNGNTVTFFSGQDVVLQLTTNSVMGLLGDAPTGVAGNYGSTGVLTASDNNVYPKHYYFGNPRGYSSTSPTARATGSNAAGEPFVYVHVFTASLSTFDRVELTGTGFEFDNFVASKAVQTPAANLVPVGQLFPAVNFDANDPDATGSMPSQNAGTQTALSLNQFELEGFVFLGWNTAQDGSGQAFADGALYGFSQSITLYAQWGLPQLNYTGPVLETFSTRSVDACQGTIVTITGARLAGVTSAMVQGRRAAVIENTASRLVIRTPAGLTAAANQSLVITSAAGTLTHQNAFNVVGSSEVASCALDTTKGYWTQAQADGRTIKIYAKNPAGSGKVQFIVDGREIAWVNAVDTNDPKLRVITTDGPMAGVNYLVRTITLNPGKNRIEIRVNGERVWRVTYLPRG